jgi:hypothetical protein
MGKYSATVADHLILPARALQTMGQQRLFDVAGQPIPTSVAVRFLIDTGSKRTTLIPGLIAHLRPALAGDVRVETSLGIGETTLFWVRLEFPGTSLAPIPEVAVARLSLPLSLSTFHGVLGRDMLRRWDSLHFEGRLGRFTVRDRPSGLLGWLGR